MESFVLNSNALLVSLALTSGLMALSLVVVAGGRNERDGLAKWAGALTLECVVWVLVVTRGMIPGMISIAGANILAVTAQSVKLAAIYEYRGKDWPRWQCLSPVSLMFMVLFFSVYESFRGRLILSSLVIAAQMLMIIHVLRTDAESRTGRAWWLLFGSVAVNLPAMLLRAAIALFGTYEFVVPQSSATPNPAQLAVFVCTVALNIMGSLGFILMIKEKADREIRALAMTDSLTKVFNRRFFVEQAEKEMAAARRNRLPLALLMIDIDHFKHINDKYGHSMGDTVLASVAGLLTSRVRSMDTLARYGGEEFCVLLPATDETGAVILAEELRCAVEAMVLGESGISVTVSIGVAVHPVSERSPKDFSRILEDADIALYTAKREGRNRTIKLSA